MTNLHPFEKAGLGKAPFHCTGVTDAWSACQFCGTPIRYRFYIAGADGSTFYVGSDCVAKTGGHQLISGFYHVRSEFLKEQREAKRKAREEARKAQWAAQRAAKRAAFDAAHPGLYDKLVEYGKKVKFLASMVQSVDQWGGLTDRQYEVAARIIKELEEGPEKLEGDLSALAAMFKKASVKVKWPKITVLLTNGENYTFSLAGEKSANPGFLYVKRNGMYLGKVSPTGELTRSGSMTEGDVRAINGFSQDPVTAAANHGFITGNCAFCRLKLTDPRSVKVGYGPVCADNFSLPWGEVIETSVA
jgi:vacuolar-type H+-ATPase subunit E/Vma4